jgi:hypothetical protein
MDPEQTLRECETHLKDGNLREAAEARAAYWGWRGRGGFSAPDGDRRHGLDGGATCPAGHPQPVRPRLGGRGTGLAGHGPDVKVAARTGRTEAAVTLKRYRLRIPAFCDRRREDR